MHKYCPVCITIEGGAYCGKCGTQLVNAAMECRKCGIVVAGDSCPRCNQAATAIEHCSNGHPFEVNKDDYCFLCGEMRALPGSRKPNPKKRPLWRRLLAI